MAKTNNQPVLKSISVVRVAMVSITLFAVTLLHANPYNLKSITNDAVISKININSASSNDLKTPHTTYRLANAIMLVSDAAYNKIVPYLTIG